ncbi:MAG: ParB/RepB/Spo0J family partition protein [Pseudomonadota bacterium]
MSEFATISLREVVASLHNPRKTFNPVTLAELAEEIRAKGVHTPVIVRPLPGARVAETDRVVKYELVAGERRLRASHMADVANIPAMIYELTDAEALTMQLTENVQREDLTELEEAEGLQTLMEQSGMTADEVAAKINKSRRYVFDRLKLLDLSHECKEAMRAGLIDISRAIRIARIPNSGLQSKALVEATRQSGPHVDQVVSVRAFESWLRANVMLPLDAAPFVITDARLVKEAGDCKKCPKRTGADPELFADVDGADICTDPICYHGKADAHRAAMVTKAEAKGMRLIEGKEAKEICNRTSGKLDGYLPLSQTREDVAHVQGDKAPTLRSILGKDAPAPVLIENPFTKELIEAVPAAETEALLVMRGLIKATQQQADKAKAAEDEIAALQRMLEGNVERATREATYMAVVDGIRAMPDNKVASLIGGDALREWMLGAVGETIDEDDMAFMLGYKFEDGQDEIDALSMHIRACSGATLLRALAIYMAMEDRWVRNEPTVLTAHAKTLAIDTAAIEKAAKAQVKANTAKQIKALQNQLKTSTAAALTPPADSPSEGEGGAQGKAKNSDTKAKTPPSAARASKTRITAEEAITGIAVAMQSVEDQATTASPDDQHAPDYYAQAVTLVRHHNDAGAAFLRRHMNISMDHADRLIKLMVKGGVLIKGYDPTGKRIAYTITPPAEATGYVLGQAITITSDAAVLGSIARKWAGREGTIAKVLGDDCYQVKLLKGGSVPMYGNQLQAAAGVSA